MKVQVDTFDLGPVAFLHQTQTWTATQNFQAVTATSVAGGAMTGSTVNTTGAIHGSDVGATGNVHADGGSVSAALDVTAGRNIGATGSVGGSYLYSSGNIDGGNIAARGTMSGAYISTSGSMDAAGYIHAAGDLYGGYIHSGGAIQSDNGNVTANNGKLRASNASGGDINAATLLAEFGSYFGGFGWQRLPSGMIIQWGNGGTSLGQYVAFPIAFPNALLGITICENAAAGSWGGGVATVHGVGYQNQFGFYHYTLSWNGIGFADAVNSYSFIAVGY